MVGGVIGALNWATGYGEIERTCEASACGP
jgi:hypothetical protein